MQWTVEQDKSKAIESSTGNSSVGGVVLQPGERGVFAISVNDQDNKPIKSGSVQAMLVDESIYDLKPLPVPKVEYEMALNLLRGFTSSSLTLSASSSGYSDTFSAFMRRYVNCKLYI